MQETYILFNPISGNRKGKGHAKKLAENFPSPQLVDVLKIHSYQTFLSSLDADDKIVLCGGDGTLNHFANNVQNLSLPCPVYYYAVGTGNDFARDIGHNYKDEPTFAINDYLKNLPTVTVGDTTRAFLNGVGYGIDGYCCEYGDRRRTKLEEKGLDKKVNYTSIAIQGVLGRFRPRNAVITVDGVEHRFTKVWLAPTMHGHYYGGGMMPTPNQDRTDEKNPMTLMVFHGAGALKTLMMFPSLFKGEHIKYQKNVTILQGKEISVTYDRPCALQIDGETYLNVSSYTAKAI